jgi:hypothetical protein
VSRFPVAFPLPAFASRSSCSRRGVGPSSRSAYRAAPVARPDPDGVTAFRTHELRPGWVPPLPRGRRCSPGQVVSLTGACRSAAASPYTPPQLPIDGGSLTRHQRGFTQFTRPVFPSPAAPGWNGPPLRLSPELRTPPTRSRRRTPRWGQANEHGPGTTRSTSHQSILQSVVHSQRATSRRTTSTRRQPARDRVPPRFCIGGKAVATGSLAPSMQRSARVRGRGPGCAASWPWRERTRVLGAAAELSPWLLADQPPGRRTPSCAVSTRRRCGGGTWGWSQALPRRWRRSRT